MSKYCPLSDRIVLSVDCSECEDRVCRGGSVAKRILECSSKGDRRFSSMYAKVTIFGVYDTIENHYQNCKFFYSMPKKVKGATPDKIIVNNRILDKKYLTPFYKLLWVKYLSQHEELVEYAKQFDDYNDMFNGKSINCQADVIRQYVVQGKQSIYDEELVIEFIKAVK